MKPNFSISSFPNDDIKRVLVIYGGLEIDRTDSSNSILIYVLLWEVDVKKNCLLNDSYIISKIPLNRLSKARIGTVWKGQVHISQDFSFSEKICNLDLRFLLLQKKPKIIKLEGLIIRDLKDMKISKNYSINDAFKNNSELSKIFSKTNYFELTSEIGIRVIVSSIVIFQSLFPVNNSIKEDLLTKSLESIINKYLYISTVPSNKSIFTRKAPYEKIGRKSLSFLKSTVESKKIYELISTLQMSLEDFEFSTEKKYSKIRHPIIKPPFINCLDLLFSGIWIQERELFLITKINNHYCYDYLNPNINI